MATSPKGEDDTTPTDGAFYLIEREDNVGGQQGVTLAANPAASTLDGPFKATRLAERSPRAMLCPRHKASPPQDPVSPANRF